MAAHARAEADCAFETKQHPCRVDVGELRETGICHTTAGIESHEPLRPIGLDTP
jgi:hypothetical protein